MIVVPSRCYLLLALCLLLNVSLITECGAQRVAVSLGSKIKNVLKGKSRSRHSAQSDSGKFEKQQDEEVEPDSETKSKLYVVIFTSVIGGLSAMLIQTRAQFRSHHTLTGDEEEILLEDAKLDSGFFHDCEIGFEDIKMVLKGKNKKQKDRLILDGSIRGKATPGRMLAVMGPSGSGKSTFLHALAGQIKDQKRIDLYGKRYVNKEPVSGDSQLPVAFIEQDVNFFPHMTVKETLDFRVELKLGSKLGKSARDDVVADLMNLLGLTGSANTIVGNTKVRGLSGGERKRLSIACELISSPPAIFLDEPTSGLDSYQAAQVIEFLRKLADSGKTVVAVIHQPSQHIFSMFDDLLLLSEGKMMYFGEIGKVRGYVEGLGYKADAQVGTAEHILDCVSKINGTPDEIIESRNRLDNLSINAKETSKALVLSNESYDKKHHKKLFLERKHRGPAANILRQFRLLFKRSFVEIFRGKAAIIIKVVQQVTIGLIYGGIYKLGDNQASIMDRFGLLSLIAIGAANMAIAGTVRSFPKEKGIVAGELSSGLYRTFPYFVSKAIAEIPLLSILNGIFCGIIYPLSGLQKGKFGNFLKITTLHSIASEGAGLLIGAVSSSSDMALALMPPILVLNIIFDGKNVSEENTPKFLRWLPKLGLIRWGFEGLALNEFEGLTFATGGPRRGPVAKTGFDALDRFGLTSRSLNDVYRAQLSIISGCWILSFLGLSLTGTKYAEMQSPELYLNN